MTATLCPYCNKADHHWVDCPVKVSFNPDTKVHACDVCDRPAGNQPRHYREDWDPAICYRAYIALHALRYTGGFSPYNIEESAKECRDHAVTWPRQARGLRRQLEEVKAERDNLRQVITRRKEADQRVIDKVETLKRAQGPGPRTLTVTTHGVPRVPELEAPGLADRAHPMDRAMDTVDELIVGKTIPHAGPPYEAKIYGECQAYSMDRLLERVAALEAVAHAPADVTDYLDTLRLALLGCPMAHPAGSPVALQRIPQEDGSILLLCYHEDHGVVGTIPSRRK